MKCVPSEQCDFKGVMVEQPINYTPDLLMLRVQLNVSKEGRKEGRNGLQWVVNFCCTFIARKQTIIYVARKIEILTMKTAVFLTTLAFNRGL